METFNRALQASLEDTPEYKAEFRARHELITTIVGMAYDDMKIIKCGPRFPLEAIPLPSMGQEC